jgi:hypothetical protein
MADSVWAWYRADCEHSAHGLFATREEALADALSKEGSGVEIVIGCATHTRPEDFVDADINAVLLDMDEQFNSEAVSLDGDEVFVIAKDRRAAARDALEAALLAWAREYVVVSEFPWYVRYGTQVTL